MEERQRLDGRVVGPGMRIWGQFRGDLVCWAKGLNAMGNKKLLFFF